MTFYKLFLQILFMGIFLNIQLLAYSTRTVSSLPIQKVILETGGQIVTQTYSGQGGPNDGPVNTAVNIKSITINDGGSKVLDNFAITGLTVKNTYYIPGSNTNLITARTNGNSVRIDNTWAYISKAQAALSGTDIRDYLLNDVPNYPYTRQLDFFYNNYTINKSHYIMVQERAGNSRFSLLPLDINGNPIPGAYRVEFIGSSAYPWNTGYSGGSDGANYQKQYFGIIKMSDFNIGNHEVYGFSYFANSADCKFYVLGIDSFTKPNLSINDIRKNEGDSGNTNFTFTLSLNQSSSSTVSVKYNTSDNTALVSDNDYNSKTGTITFTPGRTTKTVTIKVKGDTKVEPDEIFYVDLHSVTGANIADSRGIGTIVNDDTDPSNISINDIQKNEGDSGTTAFTFTVSLDNAATRAVSVKYATSDGTATTVDNDYDAKTGNINFSPGQTSATITVLVNGDTKVEPNETFSVTLYDPKNTLIADGTGIGTILNDDSYPSISINDIQKDEGDSGTTDFDFTVTLSRSYPVDVTVDYVTTDSTATIADSDYQALTTNTLTIPAGQTTATITAKVNGDTIVESDETFNIILSNPSNASISKDTGVGTILNDDSYPGITINDIQENEGNSGTTNFTFTLSLDNSYASAVSVNYATSNGTATLADNDYIAKSGTVNFLAGETSKTVTILVNGDTKVEPNETFTVTLSTPVNTTISKAIGVGTILNDDFATIGIDDVQKEEGHTGTTDFTFTLTLDKPSYTSVSVDYRTSNGTATTADSDYNAASGTLTIPADETTATIIVTVNGDTKIEEDETFTLTLSSPSNTTLGKSVGTGTIINDDFASLSVDDVSVLEGDDGITNLTFTLNLSEAFYNDVTLSYATQDGTATIADNDYIEVNATQVVFAPNETSKDINISVVGDLNIEDDETLFLLLSNPINATISDGNATGTIENDDIAILSINDVNLSEGNAGYTDFNFTVSMTLPHREDVTVNYTTYDGTALIDDNDYNQTQGTLTFEAGEIEKIVTVKVIGDFFIEDDETFTVTLNNQSSNAYISTTEHTGTGTILNDDSGTSTDKVTFNVERTNTKDTPVNAERFPWYTQISGREFDYDVVSYDKNMTKENPLSNVVVRVSLRSIDGDSDTQVDTEEYLYFSNKNTRTTFNDLKVDSAHKDAIFRIFVPTDGNGTVLRIDCSTFATKQLCYDKLKEIAKKRDTGFDDFPIDAQDNFAIRPAALYYAIDDENTSVPYLENNLTDTDIKFIAGHNYTLNIKGLSYGSSSDLMDSYNGETNATLAYHEDSGDDCRDTNDSSFSAEGNTTTSFKHSEVGIYTLGLIDNSWTEVDQNPNEDCVVDSATATDNFNRPPGCNISSEVTANSVSNQTFAYVPAKFNLNSITRRIRLDVDSIENNDTVYMNDLTGAQTPMSIEIAGIIEAQAEDNTPTTNYTNNCRAENLNFSFDLSALATDDINTTVNFDNFLTEDGNSQLVQYNFINIDPDNTNGDENNATINTPDANRTIITLTNSIRADNFRNADTNITLNLNINRNSLEAMNPKRIVFNSIGVNSLTDSINEHNQAITGQNTGLGETTLLYARVRASQEEYTASQANFQRNTPIQIEVYCNDPILGGQCINAVGTPKHGLRNDATGSGWWLSTLRSTLNGVTNINLAVTNNQFNLNDEDDVANAAAIAVRIPNATVAIANNNINNTNNANNSLVNTVCPNVIPDATSVNAGASSPWVQYGVDPLYTYDCRGAAGWSGVGNERSVVNGAGQAPAVNTNTNDRLSW